MVIYAFCRPLVKPGSSDFFHPLVRYCRSRRADVTVRALTITVASASYPEALTPRPDGDLWLTQSQAQDIGRIDPANGNVFFTSMSITTQVK